MTHKELISEMAQQLGFTQSKVSDLLDAVVSVLNEKLSENVPVLIQNFGVFETGKRAEHISVNLQTQQRHLVPPSIEVNFKPASDIKEQPETFLNPADLLANQANIPNAESEAFLKSLFDLITETLSEDEEIKIKDFGTFRLIPIQERERGNVNSLDFVPAAALKELVNKPFSHFETILLNEGVTFEGVEEVVEGKTRPTAPTAPITEPVQRTKIPPVWIPILGGVAIALASLFFFMQWQVGKQPVKDSLNRNRPSSQTSPATMTSPVESVRMKELPESLEKVVLQEGKTLRLIAEDKLGNREFWIYIYLKNKNKIKNPNIVSVGTELIIPDPSEYNIDASDSQSIAKAKALGDDELKKFLQPALQ